MAEQTFALQSGWYTENQGAMLRFWSAPDGSRIAVDADLRPGDAARFLGLIGVYSDGRVTLRIGATQNDNVGASGHDLSDLFESSGSITLTAGTNSLTVSLAGADTTEPYTWTPTNSADVTAFYNAITAAQAATFVIRDFTPAAPAFADDTGDAIMGTVGTAIADVVVPEATGTPAPTYAAVGTLPTGVSFDTGTRTLSFDENTIEAGSGTITIRATNSEGSDDWTVDYTFAAPTPGALSLTHFSATGTVHMLMRITSGNYARGNGQENLWASALWTADGEAGQVGTIEEGSAGITADVTLARFARWDSGDRLILNAQGNISNLFDQAGDPYRLTVVRETSTGYEIMTVGPPSGEPSDRTFADWRLSDGTLSQAEWDFLNAIAAGDELILAVHEGTASYSPPMDHAVDGGDATFAFAIPQPTVTHVPRPTTDHAVNGGDAVFTFLMPQATVTHTPRAAMTHEVDGGDATFAFQIPQPTVTHVPRPAMQHTVDGGDIAFNFLLPQPMVTHTPAGPQARTVDGGDASFLFEIPQPTVTHTPRPPEAHAVDGGDIAFTFLIPQPTVRLNRQHAVGGGDATFLFAIPQPTVTRRVAGGRDGGDITWMFDIRQPTVTHRTAVRSLLPPGKTAVEVALEAAIAPNPQLFDPVRDLWNPHKCPDPLLPWLAWALSVDYWDTEWTEQQKRRVVASSIEVHRLKGTVEAMRLAVESVGLTLNMEEWWEKTPTGTPGTADVFLTTLDGGTPTPAQTALAEQRLNDAKRATLHLNVIDGNAVMGRTNMAVWAEGWKYQYNSFSDA